MAPRSLADATESTIAKEVKTYLDARKIFWWRCALGGIRYAKIGRVPNPMKGYPDLSGLLPAHLGIGRLFVIETKTAKGKLTPEQLWWREKLEEHKAVYILARSVADVRKVFEPDWFPECYRSTVGLMTTRQAIPMKMDNAVASEERN